MSARWLVILTFCGAVGWSAESLDLKPPAEPAPGLAQATGTLTDVEGTLSGVDGALQVITIARRNGSERFRLSADTVVVINGERGSAAELKRDGKVRVTYRREGNSPYPATMVLDEASIAILDAEREGVEAKIESVAERGDGDDQAVVVVVTTAQGKRRELVVRPEGAWASVVMKDGKPAELGAFAPGEAVMVAVRRTGGATMYLRALADPPTYLAFCADRMLRGRVAATSDDGATFSLAPEGAGERVTVRLTRTSVFFAGGAKQDANPFKVGDEVVVKFRYRRGGETIARAVFAPDSWQAFAAWANERERPAAADSGN